MQANSKKKTIANRIGTSLPCSLQAVSRSSTMAMKMPLNPMFIVGSA
jgi:hypothetical protein